jgi:hypothetical protein
MSAHHALALTAIAFQLSAALESYQLHVDELADPWSQREQYRRVSHSFDQIRMLKGALPELSVAMVEVLIAHVELMRALWLSSTMRVHPDAAALDQLRDRHRRAVDTMHELCLRVFVRRH